MRKPRFSKFALRGVREISILKMLRAVPPKTCKSSRNNPTPFSKICNTDFQIGAVASLKAVLVVDRLPKTRSGKILRGMIKKLADGIPCEAPATIEDASVLDEIRTALTQDHVAPAQNS
jgi:hypothetical protein